MLDQAKCFGPTEYSVEEAMDSQNRARAERPAKTNLLTLSIPKSSRSAVSHKVQPSGPL